MRWATDPLLYAPLFFLGRGTFFPLGEVGAAAAAVAAGAGAAVGSAALAAAVAGLVGAAVCFGGRVASLTFSAVAASEAVNWESPSPPPPRRGTEVSLRCT